MGVTNFNLVDCLPEILANPRIEFITCTRLVAEVVVWALSFRRRVILIVVESSKKS
jgi:hypothetical protein